jgi:hypothetical protein
MKTQLRSHITFPNSQHKLLCNFEMFLSLFNNIKYIKGFCKRQSIVIRSVGRGGGALTRWENALTRPKHALTRPRYVCSPPF